MSEFRKDYCKWLAETIEILRDGRLNQLDMYELLEELATKKAQIVEQAETHLKTIFDNMIELAYPQQISVLPFKDDVLISRIISARRELKRMIEISPSLGEYILSPEVFDRCYNNVFAPQKSRLTQLGERCSFPKERILDPNWFPVEMGHTSQ